MSPPFLPEFDDAVLRAMEKWPDVPQCFGWLELDRRGQWRLRGEIIHHPRAVEFLSRHYAADEHGRWYVQNGPQQVFVTLEYTPWVYRFEPRAGFTTHTGIAAGEFNGVFADDEGNLLLDAATGTGLIDDRDLAALADYLVGDEPRSLRLEFKQQSWPVTEIRCQEVAGRFNFVSAPAAD